VPLRCDVNGKDDRNSSADDNREVLQERRERIETGRDQGNASNYDSNEARQRERSRSLRHAQEKKSADGIESSDTGSAVGSKAIIGRGDLAVVPMPEARAGGWSRPQDGISPLPSRTARAVVRCRRLLALPTLRGRLEVKNDRNIFDRIISAGRR